MGRITIASRLTLIVVGGLIVVQLLMVAAYFVDRRHAAEGATFAPLLGQIAALSLLLDKVPDADRSLVLRSAAGTGFLPSVRPDVPDDVSDTPPMRLAERRLRRLLGDGDDRFIALTLLPNSQRGLQLGTRFRSFIDSRLHAVIGLKSGDYLEVRTTGDLTMRIFGVPVGLVAGILGFFVAIVALIVVRRETRPLSELSAAIERFGPALELRPVAERGAPDVRALARSMNTMQARIVELVRSRTLVLGAISHDLRTYLTRLRLRLEMLPESEQRTKASSDLDGMQALVDDALAFARASFGDGSDESADLSFIAQVELDARIALGDNVTLSGAGAPLFVRGSSTALARVVANLVSNALAYGGCAELSLLSSEEFVELRVEDRGPGIPADARTTVFEPFYRLEPSRNRDSGGAGLGLTIVRQIVEGYGGRIVIEERPGGGARVRVHLRRTARPQLEGKRQ
jgi:signal transduction histidine kinase